MIRANFDLYNLYTVDTLYQWELNRVLNVTGLNLTVAPEVHFSNALLGGAIPRQATLENHIVSVEIPNSLLQVASTIYAHIGVYEGDEFKVIEVVEIPVKPRKRPDDYRIEDSDEEIYSFNRLENMIQNIDEKWSAFTTATVDTAVNAWLDEHPEATTTVQDRSLTIEKMVVGTLGYVTPQMFGAVGDGVTDDTEAIIDALSYGKHVIFENSEYLISDTLAVPSDIVIELRNAKIISNATENKKYIFSIVEKSNVKIYGENSTLEMTKPETTQQACISIDRSENVLVTGLTLTKAGGDGVTVGGTNSIESKNIEIAHCIIDNSRRNGISVIGGVDGVFVHDCEIKNTIGTEPQLGIDIETWDPKYLNQNIKIYNNRFENNENGDLTIFEYTSGVKVFNNHFKKGVSVKINTQYNENVGANPTDLSFHDNVFESSLYFYGIVYGGYSVSNNIYNGGKLTIESPFLVSAEDTGNVKSKLIIGNVFNNSSVAIQCGYSANMLICNNVANDCRMFLNAWGLFQTSIENNLVNGYNTDGSAVSVFEFNGAIKNVTVEKNRVVANANSKTVAQIIYYKGGSAFDNVTRDNDFTKAVYTTVILYGAQNNNIDYHNAIPDCDTYCRALPNPSKKFAGMILSLVSENSIYTYICTLVDGAYKWKDITAKL